MNKVALGLAALATLGAVPAPSARPAITGISHLAIYAADFEASDHFYGFILRARKGADPEDPRGVRYYFSPTQFDEPLPWPPGRGASPLAHAAVNTVDAPRLRACLSAHGSQPVSELHRGAAGA